MAKIAQINSVCHSSTGRIMNAIKAQSIKEGFEAICFFGRGEAPEAEGYFDIGNRMQMYRHILHTRLWDGHGLRSKGETEQLIHLLEQQKPDIIHLHNIHGYYLQVPLLFAYLKKTGIPVVWTLHDCWSYTGHCAYYDFVGCERYQSHCQNCPQKGSYPKSWLVDGSGRNFDWKKQAFSHMPHLTLVTPSHWLKDQLRQTFMAQYPAKVIPNGIDLDTFQPMDGTAMGQKLGISPEKYVILGVATRFDEPRKGFDHFMRLSRLLAEDEQILLVGATKKQLENLPGNVKAMQRTADAKELAAIYSLPDLFVNPTLEDNLPTVTMEAMACGTPVTGYATGGQPEMVEGLFPLAQKGDVEGLYAIIRQMRTQGKAAYTEACLQRAQQRFDAKICFAAYTELYRSLLG